MHDPTLFYIIVGGVTLIALGRLGWYQLRYYSERTAPFPEDKLAILRRRLPIYDNLSEADQHQLQQLVKRFLFKKRFVGCAGLEVTEDMRITVAASACLLLLNRATHEFRNVRWIYLYPAEFIVRHSVRDAAGVVSQKSGIFSGEAWHNGRIILSWNAVEKGAFDFNDGRNVVLHEFAHQLDAESGTMNGAPLLYSKGAYGSWATILSREYKSLREHAYFGRPQVLDAYGATNPAEFFAVATESFFEQPEQLAEEHEELFTELKNYYHVDPREWKPSWVKAQKELEKPKASDKHDKGARAEESRDKSPAQTSNDVNGHSKQGKRGKNRGKKAKSSKGAGV